jgi:hypothetical protein
VKFPHSGKWGGDLKGGSGMDARELYDCLVTLIDVTGDPSVDVCMIGLTMVGVVVEIGGEEISPSVICAIFEFGGGGIQGITL